MRGKEKEAAKVVKRNYKRCRKWVEMTIFAC